jgi:DNA-binding response OmpR family regulator
VEKVAAEPSAPRVAVVCQNAQMAARLVQQLRSVGITAVDVRPSVLGMVEPAAFDVCVLGEPIPQSLQSSLRLGSKQQVTVMVVTASQQPETRAQWIEKGADDCISAPTNALELAARARALWRRAQHPSKTGHLLSFGRLVVDVAGRDAYLNGKRLELTSIEFDLLASFAQRAEQILSREQLLELTKGASDDNFDRCIDVQVSRLRAKLGDDPRNPHWIKTVRGKGYLLHGS